MVAGDLDGGAVVSYPVDLDDHMLFAPERVDLDTAHHHVHLRDRQPGRFAQLEHAPLELGSCEAQLREVVVEGSAQCAAAGPATTRKVLQCLDVQQPSVVRVGKRVPQAAK
jgi:hypothetical protein